MHHARPALPPPLEHLSRRVLQGSANFSPKRVRRHRWHSTTVLNSRRPHWAIPSLPSELYAAPRTSIPSHVLWGPADLSLALPLRAGRLCQNKPDEDRRAGQRQRDRTRVHHARPASPPPREHLSLSVLQGSADRVNFPSPHVWRHSTHSMTLPTWQRSHWATPSPPSARYAPHIHSQSCTRLLALPPPLLA